MIEEFHYTPRPDANGFTDGHVWDLGGTHVEAVHLPGHTRGHSGFRIAGGVFFLSDIDLTGFGPYYGDVWSDLEDFERSLERGPRRGGRLLRHVPPPRRDRGPRARSSSCSTSSRPSSPAGTTRCSRSSPSRGRSTTWSRTASSTASTSSTCSPTASSDAAPACTCSGCSRAARPPRSSRVGSRPGDDRRIAVQIVGFSRSSTRSWSIMRPASWLRWWARSDRARGRGQLLADLWAGRVGGVPPRPTETHERAIAGVEAGEHFAAIVVLEQFEAHVPVAGCGCHGSMIRPFDRDTPGPMRPIAGRSTRSDVTVASPDVRGRRPPPGTRRCGRGARRRRSGRRCGWRSRGGSRRARCHFWACARQRSGSPPAYCACGRISKPSHGRPGRLAHAPHLGDPLGRLVVRAAERHPPVAEPGAPVEQRRCRPAEQHRDRLARPGQDAGVLEVVELAVEAEDVLGPEPAHQLDLFGLAPAAGVEVLVERVVLDGVPADADAEPQPVARTASRPRRPAWPRARPGAAAGSAPP